MSETTLQHQIVALVRQGRQTEHDVLAALPPEAQTTAGTIEKWSVKDVVAHLAVSRQGFTDTLIAGREGRDWSTFTEDALERNDNTFAQYHDFSWGEINTLADTTVAALVAELGHYDDGQLVQNHMQAWMPEQANLLDGILGTCINHPYQHLSLASYQHGNSDMAIALLVRVISIFEQFTTKPSALAMANYEIATHYGFIERIDLAIPLFRRAFAYDPAYFEWSKEDSDLDSLRDSAEFQALYA